MKNFKSEERYDALQKLCFDKKRFILNGKSDDLVADIMSQYNIADDIKQDFSRQVTYFLLELISKEDLAVAISELGLSVEEAVDIVSSVMDYSEGKKKVIIDDSYREPIE